MHRNGTKGIPALIEPAVDSLISRQEVSVKGPESCYSNGQICVAWWTGCLGLCTFCLLFSPHFLWASPHERERVSGFSFNNFHQKKKKGICSQSYRRSRIERKKLFPGVLSVLCRGQFSIPWDSGRAPLFSKYTLPSVGKVVHFHSADKTELKD